MQRAFTVLALSGLVACAATQTDELVGTWQSHDGRFRVTYARDHTFAVAEKKRGRYIRTRSGTWRIENAHLEADFASPDATLWKRIVQLDRDRLRLEDEGTYLRVR